MNDDPTLAALTHRLTGARDSLSDEHMTIPATEIIARDTKRRGRQWLAAAGASCAAAGLAVALTLTPGSSARPAPVHTQLAAWTVRTNPDGTVTFTLRSTSHPAQLQHALAEAGVRAVVRSGEICLAGGRGQPLLGTGGFLKSNSISVVGDGAPFAADLGSYFAVQGGSGPDPDLGWSWIVIPSKMPRDGQFVISAIPGPVPAEYIKAVWEFAKTSAPVSCAKLWKPGQHP
jgi:hypothetical protein